MRWSKAKGLVEDMITQANADIKGYIGRILEPFTQEDEKIAGQVSALEASLAEADSKNEELTGTVGRLQKQVDAYGPRLAELESRQHKADIVSEILEPKGDITHQDVMGIAEDITDKDYQEIRDYFILEMAKKGYDLVMPGPDCAIKERESQLVLRFNTLGSGQGKVRFSELPEFELKSVSGDVNTIYVTKPDARTNTAVEMTVSGRGNWAYDLREDLPLLLNAYMLGYTLKCFESDRSEMKEEGIMVRDKFGLEENTKLNQRLVEAMQKDSTLANLYTTHYAPKAPNP